MNILNSEKIQLKSKQDWHYQLADKVGSDTICYQITYNLTDENNIIFVELIGDGLSKLVRINLNTTKGVKTGEFKSQATFSNIYFQVERIRFFSESDLEFHLTLFKN
jgi:hypothetical protein